jgi:small-conductance mechanosensitive channel
MEGIMDYLPQIMPTTSSWLNAAFILALSAVAAVLTDLFVTRVLLRLVSSTATDFDNRLVALLHRPIFISVLLFGVFAALRLFDSPRIFDLLLLTLLVVIWALTALKVSSLSFEYLSRLIPGEGNAGQGFAPLLKNITVVFFFALGVMGVLTVWDVSITPLLASAGLAGAAVAFAAKDTISNFLGGVSILVDRPYTVGHYIVLDSGERGEVVDIGLRSTRIKTRDDILIAVPNSLMANSKIINESAPVKRFRVRIPVGVAYGSDLKKVETILLGAAAANAGVEKYPEPRVRFRTFADSSLNFELLCWAADPEMRGRITHELNTAVYGQFEAGGVKIPFPQRDVHLYRSDG